MLELSSCSAIFFSFFLFFGLIPACFGLIFSLSNFLNPVGFGLCLLFGLLSHNLAAAAGIRMNGAC